MSLDRLQLLLGSASIVELMMVVVANCKTHILRCRPPVCERVALGATCSLLVVGISSLRI